MPTCEYFAELAFLHDVVTGRKTETNVPIEIAESHDLLATDEDKSSTSLSSTMEDNSPSKPEISDSKALQKARKRQSEQIDDLLALSLANDITNAKNCDSKNKATNSEDQDVLFCSSLVTTFKNLTGKRNKLAKIKVLQLLAEYEEDDEL